MKDWLITTKLKPTSVSGAVLPRPALCDALDAGLANRLLIVHAPAGFGKTQALTAWYNRQLEQKTRCGWLSLDDKDQDPFHFLSYLIEACRAGGLIREDELPPAHGGFSEYSHNEVTAVLMTALGRCRKDGVLILDDYHRADTAENAATLNSLLTHASEHVHVIVSTREYPASLALADLRSREQLAEIDADSLCFREQEIEAHLKAFVSADTEEGWATDLYERTEGWPIAVNTVRRWLKEGMSIEDTLAQISGRSSDLADYFVEQVFHGLHAETQKFLLETSVLERVSGDLANHICGQDLGWEVLEDLERRDLFVQRLDRERYWYRYHRLFSEFLQERMRRQDGNRLADLHEAASCWFIENDFESEAVHHALASGRAEVIATLLERLGGWHYGLRGHVGALARGLSMVDESMLSRYPRVWTAKIYLALRQGEIESAQRHLAALEDNLAEPPGAAPSLQNDVSVLRVALNVYADTPVLEEDLQRLEGLGEVLGSGNDVMHAVRCNLLCAIHASRGNLEMCMDFGDRAIRHFRAIGSIFGETFIYFHEGYANLTRGKLRDAQALYEVGHDLAVEHFGPGSDLAAIASALLAETAYETNNLHQAGQLLKVALPHIEHADAWIEVYIAAYATAFKLTRTRFSIMSVAEIKEGALATASRRRLPRLKQFVELQTEELTQWNAFESSRTADRHELSGAGEMIGTETIGRHPAFALETLEHRVEARRLIMQGEVNAARSLLEQHRSLCYDNGQLRSAVCLGVLLAAAHHKQGDAEQAAEVFEAALTLSLFEGMKRPFIDERSVLTDFIQTFARSSAGMRGNRLRDRFMAELMLEMTSDADVADEPNALSAREREILHLIVQGRSNREIAEEKDISINTVKFHVKNLYEKLGVSDRKSAVNTAIRNGFA